MLNVCPCLRLTTFCLSTSLLCIDSRVDMFQLSSKDCGVSSVNLSFSPESGCFVLCLCVSHEEDRAGVWMKGGENG